jgi:hypothetical protein
MKNGGGRGTTDFTDYADKKMKKVKGKKHPPSQKLRRDTRPWLHCVAPSGLKKEERPSFRGLPPPAIIYHPFGIKKKMTGGNHPPYKKTTLKLSAWAGFGGNDKEPSIRQRRTATRRRLHREKREKVKGEKGKSMESA